MWIDVASVLFRWGNNLARAILLSSLVASLVVEWANTSRALLLDKWIILRSAEILSAAVIILLQRHGGWMCVAENNGNTFGRATGNCPRHYFENRLAPQECM